MDKKFQIAVFGGGCFWCTEAVFERLKGVVTVTSGYAGGELENPAYEEVSSGNTGHAEVVKVDYDPSQVTFETLLDVFFSMHDPTTIDQQGADIGSQYRSLILYTSVEQKEQAEKYVEDLEDDQTFGAPIVTEIKPLDKFYAAEEDHQKYYENNPEKSYCQVVINPKIAKLREKYSHLLKIS